MRYILVLDRVPLPPKGVPRVYCPMCVHPIEGPYVREISTRIAYCSTWCLAEHIAVAVVPLITDQRYEHAARMQ